MTDVGICGGGAWGQALAYVLHRKGLEIAVWSRRTPPQPADGTAQTQDIASACDSPIVILAVPTAAMHEVAQSIAGHLAPQTVVVSAAKGFEPETGRTMSQMLGELIPNNPVAAVSGPNLADEIMQGSPAATVVASSHSGAAEQVRDTCTSDRLRWYSSSDIVGVEYAGALKNVIAIAAGMCDGLGVGDNGKAAIVTRGLAEVARLGIKAGAQPLTFAGLAGVGDCFATCMSPLSRNRRLGEAVAGGESVEVAQARIGTVEGLGATRAAVKLAATYGVEVPIAEAIHDIFFEQKPVIAAMAELMNRDPGDELPV